jgi:DNA-binding CsgD family transcriptional regulator
MGIPEPDARLSNKPEPLTQSEERRKERMERSLQLRQQGWSQKEIARQLHLHPKTVRRYRSGSSPKARRHPRGSRLDPYQSYLVKRWNEGCHNATQLFREIKKQGFQGNQRSCGFFSSHSGMASNRDMQIKRNDPHR